MLSVLKNKVAARFIAPVGILIAAAALPVTSYAAGPAGQVRSFGRTVAHIIEGERTMAPFASVVFCVQNPDQCKDTGGPDVITLDAEHKAELFGVNASVNHSIRPMNDPVGTDIWSVDVTAGDCEDYALTNIIR